jgi:hypothetical protein
MLQQFKADPSFSQFCYLIRVEHEKYFVMCVLVIGFGQKMRNWVNHITTRGCYIKKVKNMAECLYHTFITALFNWSQFFC